MHFCYESEKTVNGPICSRIVALYHRNSHLEKKILELESNYDEKFHLIFKAIKELMQQKSIDGNRPIIGYKKQR